MNEKRTFFKEFGFLFILVLVMSPLAGCDGNKNDTPKPLSDVKTVVSIREIAWNQLSNEDKNSVVGDWKTSDVKIVKRDDVPFKKTSIKPERIYKVTFKTKIDEQVGPIGIYIDSSTKEMVGYDVRN